jgi:hypothetical protein
MIADSLNYECSKTRPQRRNCHISGAIPGWESKKWKLLKLKLEVQEVKKVFGGTSLSTQVLASQLGLVIISLVEEKNDLKCC